MAEPVPVPPMPTPVPCLRWTVLDVMLWTGVVLGLALMATLLVEHGLRACYWMRLHMDERRWKHGRD